MAQRISVPQKIKEQVLTEAGYRCPVPTCHTTLAIDLHHLEEVSEGGSNAPENLLPLCPTCHRLYHNGTIPRHALLAYKERLQSANKIFNEEYVDRIVSESIDKALKEPPASQGLGLACAQFMRRTCRLGIRNGKLVKTAGYGCFIGKGKMVTSNAVLKLMQQVLDAEGDEIVVWSQIGLATFKVEEISAMSGIVVLQVNAFDTSYAERVAQKTGTDYKKIFDAPIEAPIRYRSIPLVGEDVGILHSPALTEPARAAFEFQFERASIAFRNRPQSGQSLFTYTLTQLPSRIEYGGSPVFNSDGALVGIISDTSRQEPEIFRRPICMPLLGLKALPVQSSY